MRMSPSSPLWLAGPFTRLWRPQHALCVCYVSEAPAQIAWPPTPRTSIPNRKDVGPRYLLRVPGPWDTRMLTH